MDKEKPKLKTIPFDKWFEDIIKVHGENCYLLIQIKDGKIGLVAGGSSMDYLQFIKPEKIDYAL